MSDVEPALSRTNTHRRWFRFSVRTLLLFVVLVSVLSAWLGKHIMRAQIQRPIVSEIVATGGSVVYDYQMPSFHTDSKKSPPGPSIVRSVLGDDTFATVEGVFLNGSNTSDGDVEDLYKLTDLRDVSLYGTRVTDNCIDNLLRIRRLRGLNFLSTSITPEGLKRLSQSRTLEHLSLSRGGIRDSHIRQLKGFPNLQYLQLIHSSVTDDGIKSLGSLVKLRQLDIFGAPSVSDVGIRSLEQLVNLEQLCVLQSGLSDASVPIISRMVLCLAPDGTGIFPRGR